MITINELTLLGVVAEPLVLKETARGTRFAELLIDVPSPKPEKTDRFCIHVWNNLLDKVTDVKVGDKIHLKGYLSDNNYLSSDGTQYYRVDIVATKIYTE